MSSSCFTDGGSQTLSTAQGGTFAVGVRARPVRTLPLSVFASVGYKFVLSASDNADIRLTRIPLELVTGPMGGMTSSRRLPSRATPPSTLHGDDVSSDVDFEPANGAPLGTGWRWIGATYTAIRHTADDGTEFDASNLGVTLRASLSDF